MSIENILEDARQSLSDLKKKHSYKKANRSREEAAELQASLLKCRGQLEICKKEYKRTVGTQSRAVQEGKQAHADTMLQEQMLWDAAMGYLLVQDAIYAVKTINSYDAIAHASDMLDAAVNQMKGKKNKLLDKPFLKKPGKRNAYGYMTSESAVEEKETVLENIFEELKEGKDIDKCIEDFYAGRYEGTSAETLEDFERRTKAAEATETFDLHKLG